MTNNCKIEITNLFSEGQKNSDWDMNCKFVRLVFLDHLKKENQKEYSCSENADTPKYWL